MKIALVHDYIKEYGGAERVLEALHALYPDVPVYTSLYAPEFLGPHQERFASWDIRTTWLQHIPFKEKMISPLRLLAPFAFGRLDLSAYDVIITSATGAYFPNRLQKGKAVLISYCHTPPRYLYGYMTAREWKKNIFFRILGEIANHFLRIIDYKAAQNVDHFIANSQEVAGRIKKFYRKEAMVIYPPVDTKQVAEKNKRENYYVAGSRLTRSKHLDIIVKTCTQLQIPLKVFGKAFAGYGEELKAMAGPTVEFVGEVTDAQKYTLMRNAKAFLFASEDEDFGIAPVEAMGQGTPVIAYRSGGPKETIIEGKTGLFFDELSVASLKDAIKEFETTTLKAEDCITQAEKFSKERFMKAIKNYISAKRR